MKYLRSSRRESQKMKQVRRPPREGGKKPPGPLLFSSISSVSPHSFSAWNHHHDIAEIDFPAGNSKCSLKRRCLRRPDIRAAAALALSLALSVVDTSSEYGYVSLLRCADW
eukprot:GHVU01108962.1.p1 GENE.GHVU01108962.1~~GHVU01108962.1.p1  ORF type:complete len:111 (+),score=1.71 GHVU01108962.1:257-589(+)